MIFRVNKQISLVLSILLYFGTSIIASACMPDTPAVIRTIIIDVISMVGIMVINLFDGFKRKVDTVLPFASNKPTIRDLVVITSLIYMTSLSFYWLSIVFPSTAGQASRQDAFSSVSPAVAMCLSLFVAPAFEETMFRFAMFGNLIDKNSTVSDIVIKAVLSSFIFGAFHGTTIHLITGTLFGLECCLIFYMFRSLGLNFFVHVMYNCLTVFIVGELDVVTSPIAVCGISLGVFILVIFGFIVLHRMVSKREGIQLRHRHDKICMTIDAPINDRSKAVLNKTVTRGIDGTIYVTNTLDDISYS